MRFTTCFVALLFITSSLAAFRFNRPLKDSRDTLQQLYNGLFEQANLPDPTTVVSCYDDNSAALTVTFIGKVLDQLANNDIFGAQSTVSTFQQQLPQAVKTCLNQTAEMQQAYQVYRIAGLTLDQIQSKITNYAFGHLFEVHEQAVTGNNDFKKGDYVSVGKIGGQLAQKVFGSSKSTKNGLKDDKDTLQQLFNGFFEQANLADPTTVVQCFDDSSATLTVQTLGTILAAAAKNDITGAENAAKNYMAELPQPVQDCMKNNAEIQTALTAYHLTGLTPQQIQQKVEKYALAHFIALHKDAVQANNDFQAGKYNQVGHEAGAILQAIFGNGMTFTDDRDTLQQLFNGFFEQANLADPTTVVQCFDDSSATLTVQTLGTILAAAAKNDIAGAENAAKNYIAQLPKPVQDCMNTNTEIQTALTAYHITGLTPQQIQQKVEKYALTHFIALHKDAVQANNDFQAGNYQQVGHEAGGILQGIFGNGMRGFTDDAQTLQLLFNGFFEQAGLADPTTVVACFDDSSATLTVQTLGTILAAAAKNDITGAENAAKNYMAELPQPVQDCMKNNAEIQNALTAYHVTGLTPQQIQQKVEKYALTHFIALHKDAVQANNDFQAGNYQQVGHEAGAILQAIFGNGMTFTDDKDTLQLLFNGFFEQAGLADPTTVVACFDDSSATLTVQTLGTILTAVAKNDINGATNAAKNYMSQLPQPVQDCMKNNAEIQNALTAYRLTGLTPQQIQQKVEKYALTHLIALHKAAVQANNDFQAGNYNQVGHEAGAILQAIFGNGMTYTDDRDTLQLIFNGFFEEGGLPDPTTVVNCFDDASATLTVQTIGKLLDQVAHNKFTDAQNTAKAFGNQLPDSVKTCLKTNAEIQAALSAYHIAGLSSADIQKKVEKYVAGHLISLHKDCSRANDDFKSGKYAQVGHDAGSLVHKIFGNGMTVYGDDRDTLQQLFNGFFEQVSLADPTTVVQCFDDASATLTVQTLGTILAAAAKNDIAGAENAAKNYIAQLPKPVQDCMNTNTEIQNALNAYHIAGLTSQQIQQKVEKYALTHIFALHKDAVQANNDFQAGNYQQVGHEAGAILQAIFGNGRFAFGNLRDDKDTLQLIFNGFFEEGGLPDPTTVVNCFDDTSATLTVQTIGKLLDQVAHNKFTDAQNTAKAFGNQLPDSVKACLKTNAEIQAALSAYHIAGLSSADIQKKVEKYVAGHLISLHKDCSRANDDFKDGKYAQVGHDAGSLVHKIFGNGMTVYGDDRDTLQQLFNGFFEQAGLADPTTVVQCFDDSSATLTVQTLGTILTAAAKNDINGATNAAKNYMSQLPQPVQDCMKNNAEIQNALTAYHLTGLTPQEIQQKVEKYALTHIFALHKAAVQANNDFQAGNYNQVGHEAGAILQAIFGNGMRVYGDDRDTLQQLFNGFFEQANLADPTTVVQCFDDSSATLTVQTLGTILTAAAKNDINGATNAAKNYMSQLPQPVQDCMKNNAEIQTALSAYHLAGLTPQEIQQKVEKYALTHIFALHKAAVQANNDFQAGKYNQVGHEAGAILQAIFGNGMRGYADDAQTLQLLFNGFFEQAGLADPTTVVQCFDDSSATLTVQTLGTILAAAAKNDIAGAENAAKNYMAQLPQPVQDCMKNNAEIQNALTAYHIAGLTSQQIQQKVEKYALTHFIALHKDAVQANNDFQAGNYQQVGHEAGAILQAIFGNGMTFTDDRDTLQQLFNGFFEQANLADPTTVVQCFDDSSATLTVQALGTILAAAAKNDITGVENAAKNYMAELPQPVQDCLKTNAEIQSVLSAYHLTGLTPQQIQQKVEKYALSHLFQLHHDAVQANNDFVAGNYNQVGKEAGDILQKIFASKNRPNFQAIRDAQTTKLNGNPFQELVQVFAGFWSQAGLPQPTTPITCFELDTADVTIKFIGQLALDLANDEFVDFDHAVDNYKTQVPKTVLDCFFGDSQVAVIEKSYGVQNMTISMIESKLATYALSHYKDFHNVSVAINQNFQMGKFEKTGKFYGQLLQNMIAN